MIAWEEKQGVTVKAPHGKLVIDSVLSDACSNLEQTIMRYLYKRDFDPDKDVVFEVTLRVEAEER